MSFFEPHGVLALLLSVAACGGGSTSSATDAALSVDAAAPAELSSPAAFGGLCDASDNCPDGLRCLAGPKGGSFCTKTCPATQSGACSGTPTGTAAYCVVTDATPNGDKGCAFLCGAAGKSYACPGLLKCEATDDPPGTGQRSCLPE